MSNFKFIQDRIFKLDGRGSGVISNANITDAKALQFLRPNTARICLFREFPEDWRDMLEEDKQPITDIKLEDIEVKDWLNVVWENPEEIKEKKPCTSCDKKKLAKINFQDLKELYPDVKVTFGMKKTELIDAIVASQSK